MHRLDNLRFLCPNCNAQQPTFASKNIGAYSKEHSETVVKKIEENREIRSKEDLAWKNRVLKQIPKKVQISKKDLINSLIRTRSFVRTGAEFGCSDNIIKKKWLSMNVDYYKIFRIYPLADEILKFYKKSKSKNLTKIARHFRTSTAIIKIHVEKHFNLNSFIKINEKQKRLIKSLRRKGLTIQRISDQTGISVSAVRRHK